jgi:hypothetical protein
MIANQKKIYFEKCIFYLLDLVANTKRGIGKIFTKNILNNTYTLTYQKTPFLV